MNLKMSTQQIPTNKLLLNKSIGLIHRLGKDWSKLLKLVETNPKSRNMLSLSNKMLEAMKQTK